MAVILVQMSKVELMDLCKPLRVPDSCVCSSWLRCHVQYPASEGRCVCASPGCQPPGKGCHAPRLPGRPMLRPRDGSALPILPRPFALRSV